MKKKRRWSILAQPNDTIPPLYNKQTEIQPKQPMIRSRSKRVLRGYLSAASIGKTTKPARQAHRFHQTRHSTPLRYYHATSIDGGDEPSSTRTPWSELIATKIGSGDDKDQGAFEKPSWSEEWKRLGLGADLVEDNGSSSNSDDDERNKYFPSNLFFVQLGFGVVQHGDRHRHGFATKAAIRAVRNAIEFNSIPGVIDHIPGGRKEMLIHARLGVPSSNNNNNKTTNDAIDALEVAKVFPYGRLLPIEVVRGGLDFRSGRVVEELGDQDDVGICCVACVSIGYNTKDDGWATSDHTTHNTTNDGY